MDPKSACPEESASRVLNQIVSDAKMRGEDFSLVERLSAKPRSFLTATMSFREGRCAFPSLLILFQKEHLLRLHKLSSLQAIEVDPAFDVRVPLHLVVTRWLMLIHERCHELTKRIEDFQSDGRCLWEVEANCSACIERIGIVLRQRKL